MKKMFTQARKSNLGNTITTQSHIFILGKKERGWICIVRGQYKPNT